MVCNCWGSAANTFARHMHGVLGPTTLASCVPYSQFRCSWTPACCVGCPYTRVMRLFTPSWGGWLHWHLSTGWCVGATHVACVNSPPAEVLADTGTPPSAGVLLQHMCRVLLAASWGASQHNHFTSGWCVAATHVSCVACRQLRCWSTPPLYLRLMCCCNACVVCRFAISSGGRAIVSNHCMRRATVMWPEFQTVASVHLGIIERLSLILVECALADKLLCYQLRHTQASASLTNRHELVFLYMTIPWRSKTKCVTKLKWLASQVSKEHFQVNMELAIRKPSDHIYIYIKVSNKYV